MKKIIFICLLSLSVCLSQPADQPNPAPPTEKPAAPAAKPAVPAIPATVNGTDTKPTGQDVPAQTTPAPGNPPHGTEPDNKSPGQPQPPAGVKNDTAPVVPTEAPKKNDTTTVKPDGAKNDSTIPTVKPDNHNDTSTETPLPKPTASTPKTVVTSTSHPPTLQARGFDGASFVGGIILTLGLIAIGFMGLKYYRAQTERNYHTL